MGCCYSYEEEDDHDPHARQRTPAVRHAYVRTVPVATTSSHSNYEYNPYYKQQYRAVSPPSFRSVPIRHQVSKPNVRAVVVKPTQEFKPRPGALYGEYKCSCGYFWVSRLSWRDKYQQCKRCKGYVRPKNQRELRPSDFTRGANDEGLDHPQELCEMCKLVGGYCGRYK